MAPTDYKINHYKTKLIEYPGDHKLVFKGTGASDGYGLTIDNVTIRKRNNYNKNYVVNGNF